MIFVSILNYNHTENAVKLAKLFAPHFSTVIIDSGSEDIGNVPHNKTDTPYYTGQFNKACQLAFTTDAQYVLFICSDIQMSQSDADNLIKALNYFDISDIGLYSPAISGRAHNFMKRQSLQQLREVQFVEGMIFAAKRSVLEAVYPVNPGLNSMGWGIDVHLGYVCQQQGFKCYVDDGIEVTHPETRQYSAQTASNQFIDYVKTMNLTDFVLKNECLSPFFSALQPNQPQEFEVDDNTVIIAPFANALQNGFKNPKNYPYWPEIIDFLKQSGKKVLQIGRSGEAKLPGVDVFIVDGGFKDIEKWVDNCDFWLSVDSFLQHLVNCSCKKPGVVIWSQSDPQIFGYDYNLNLIKDTKYLRNSQFAKWDEAVYNPDAFISPDAAIAQIKTRFTDK